MDPILTRQPLLLRLCNAFVDNLRLILETAFLLGAIFLAHDFRDFHEEMPQQIAEIEPVPTNPAPQVIESVPETPIVTDRVKHFFNCTYGDYRAANYAECVDAESDIYPSPAADPDDTGHLYREPPVLLAAVDTLSRR